MVLAFSEFILLMTGPSRQMENGKVSGLLADLFREEAKGKARQEAWGGTVWPLCQLCSWETQASNWKAALLPYTISSCLGLVDWGFLFLISERVGKFKWDFYAACRGQGFQILSQCDGTDSAQLQELSVSCVDQVRNISIQKSMKFACPLTKFRQWNPWCFQNPYSYLKSSLWLALSFNS